MAEIVVERAEGSLADRRSIYRVYIDGEHRGDLASMQAQSFQVPIGAHTVKMCVGSHCLPPIKVAVLNKTKLTCRPGWAHALGMVSRTAPGKWITVQEEPDTIVSSPGVPNAGVPGLGAIVAA